MNMKIAGSVVGLILSLFISLPIWFYLLYNLLKLVGASQLMFFLFWVYVPVNILVLIIGEIIKHTGD